MPILRYFTFCMSRSKATIRDKHDKLFTDNDDLDIFYTNDIPQSIKDLLVYIAREGVAVVDIFRRPGNTQQIKRVIRQVKRGENIDWTKFNFYTLANVAKRYLLQIDKGILGTEVENEFLVTLDLPDDQSRIESMSRTIQSLSPNVQQLLALLFGTWFRMIYHSEVNAMSVEAVAKSVAGSIFPSCTTNPSQVNKASKVMEYLITGFASSELFGAALIEYFTTETQTSISRTEKFKYEFLYPKNVSKKKSTRLFVRMLLEESSKHGFDLLKDEVTEQLFNSVDNCVKTQIGDKDDSDLPVPDLNSLTGNDGDPRTRKRRLSKTMTYPYCGNAGYRDQVQQTSEKRTCVTASATDIGLTATRSTQDFDVSQEQYFGHSPASPTAINKKTARLDISDETAMDDIIKDELKKIDLENCANSKSETLPPNGGRYSHVKMQQLERLQKRSEWFLSAPTGCKSRTLMPLSVSETESVTGADRVPMNADQTDSIVRNGKSSDRTKGQTPTRQCQSAQIFLSDPLLFLSSSGDHNHNLMPASDHNDCNLSEDEVEVRYFVVHKYYGPMTTRLPQAEEEEE